MDFTLSEEQRMLRDTVGRFVRDTCTFEHRLDVMNHPDGFSREVWAGFAELGLLGVPFAEDCGGFGGGAVDVMLVMEEIGRGLVVEPYLATVILGGGLVERLGSDAQKQDILEGVIGGDRLLAFAHGEPESRYALADVRTVAETVGNGFRLTGRKGVVLHGDSADQLIVSARTGGEAGDPDGIALFVVDAGAPGVKRRGYRTVDGLRAAEIDLDGVTVAGDAILGEPGEAYPVIVEVVGRGIAALSAEAVGGMEGACDLTLDYLKTRNQFGVPIGKFQSLQHCMVEMRIHTEQARSMAILAACSFDEPTEIREPRLSAAKCLIGQAGRFVAEHAIQLHGGIGMSWEYALCHYAKRLVMIDHQFGDVDHHLERFAALVDGRTAAA